MNRSRPKLFSLTDLVKRLGFPGIQSKAYKGYAAWMKDVWAAKPNFHMVRQGKQHFVQSGDVNTWNILVIRFVGENDQEAQALNHQERWKPEDFDSNLLLHRNSGNDFLVQATKKKRTYDKEAVRTATGPGPRDKKRTAGADFEDKGKERVHALDFIRNDLLVSLKGKKGKSRSSPVE
jgi:hypothetical protein